ncbi:shikimate kinase [Limibacter armeniacum]|uniref:shikimate kinase n=1 Tax=Limibacter armeniacum TaxID=466084 RepID=UPI002FE5A2CA
MRVYLIGMPGSGKSTLGKKLAEAMQYAFVDLDTEIESSEGKSIPDIFEHDGEDYFRKIEKYILQKTTPDNTIIATGGGAPCFYDNMDFINNNGVSIFIDTPVKELASRVMKQIGDRPLLDGIENLEDMTRLLAGKREKRIGFYEQADIVLEDDQEIDITSLVQQVYNFDKQTAQE